MNVYDIVTERIIAKLQNGEVPWRRPWGIAGKPMNYHSKKEYRGINTMLLGCAREATPWWMTMKQIDEMGGSVIAGSKGMPVVFFKWMEKETPEREKDQYPVLRYYLVWNASQVKGIEFPSIEKREFDPIPACEAIHQGMPNPPTFQSLGGAAWYSPSKDVLNMPDRKLFKSAGGFYETLFHEMGHSTGHDSRLARHAKEGADCHFGSGNYAKEELVAEMTSAFLCAEAGIEPDVIDNQAAYVDNWLGALKRDSRLVVLAAGQAQKAADYIMGRKSESAQAPGPVTL